MVYRTAGGGGGGRGGWRGGEQLLRGVFQKGCSEKLPMIDKPVLGCFFFNKFF